ncbi:MAG: hypothetical protein ACUVQ9_11495 [Thermodesulfobacteriota bacterium]
MADFYSEGKLPNKEIAEEILDRLGKNNNYIPSSARREYRSVILKEYRDYLVSRKDKIP